MSIVQGRFFLLATLVLVSACQTSPKMEARSQSKDKISYNPESTYLKPEEVAQMKPVIVKEYIPVAIPGQLRPLPYSNSPSEGEPGAPTFKTKEEAVQFANQNATMTPSSDDFFNAMMTYSYMPGAMYTIYTAPMRITDIMFDTGEKIISQAAGDTLRWQIAQTRSGEGSQVRQHLLVKPSKPDMENTVVVTTNRRVYHLVIKSTNNDAYMVSVKWNYERNMVKQVDVLDDESSGESASTNGGGPSGEYALDLNDLNFNYQFGLVKGNKPSWYPERVFHNDHQTFIAFGAQFNSSDLPILFVKNEQGRYSTMVNWRLKGKYMVVDTIVRDARLQSGVQSTGDTIVQIQLAE